MLRFMRRRPNRPERTRFRPEPGLDALERRELLTGGPNGLSNFYSPLYPFGTTPAQQFSLTNQGKLVTGTDLQGDTWQIRVQGPGQVVVTDVSPNDGLLDNSIDTIQLINTDPRLTHVTGTVSASPRVLSAGIIPFQHLVANSGVASVVLNGFTLTRDPEVPPPTSISPEIYMPGGVGLLQFHNIDLAVDQAVNANPINIVIGDPNSPLKTQPTIRLDEIFNTVFDSTAASIPNGFPQQIPTVNIQVNGVLRGLDIVSSTAAPLDAGAVQSLPPVSTTGRTAIRATAIGALNVRGSVKNFTAARGVVPFQGGFSGLNYLHSAKFGGNVDALGLDVNGRINRLTFAKGMGDPTGTSLSPTQWGQPDALRGYPSFGFYGALVRANSIGKVNIGPANVQLATATNPQYVQLKRQGSTFYVAKPGTAMTAAVIASAGNIDSVNIVGSSQVSEVRAGYHYPSFVAGLEPTRSPSTIGHFRQTGDLANSIVAATYRPGANASGQLVFGSKNDVPGPGLIRGVLGGTVVKTGLETPLTDFGSGVFAARKIGHLPTKSTFPVLPQFYGQPGHRFKKGDARLFSLNGG